MVLEMPSRPVKTERAPASDASSTPKSSGSSETVVASRPRSSSLALSPSQKPVSPPAPALLSVLVICPLPNSRRAIVRHIETVVPQTSPHHITAPVTLDECKKLLGIGPGSEPVIFTHVVLVSHQVEDIALFTNQIFNFASYTSTSLVVMADFTQRKEVEAQIGEDEFTKIMDSRRFRWLTKPLKPSKFASVFDPLRQRELSADRSQDSAQAVVMSQKQIFDELKRRLGNRGMRVLLVEDNKTNQMVSNSSHLWVMIVLTFSQVLQKFLSKVEITVDTVLDGQECTDAVFGNPAGHYSIILVCSSLHMVFAPSVTNIFVVRSPHAKQGWVPDLSRDPQERTKDQVKAHPHHRPLSQRPGRCLPEMCRRRVQLLRHQAGGLQGVGLGHAQVPGSCGSKQTY